MQTSSTDIIIKSLDSLVDETELDFQKALKDIEILQIEAIRESIEKEI
jgi:hypothetical protein